jgi:hypothetical protein
MGFFEDQTSIATMELIHSSGKTDKNPSMGNFSALKWRKAGSFPRFLQSQQAHQKEKSPDDENDDIGEEGHDLPRVP